MNPLISHIINALRSYYPESELRELAFLVAEEVAGMSRTQLLLDDRKDTQNIPNIETILQKLRQHEPVQYIFSHTEWMGLNLKVTPDTLIPRPETAELVEWVLQKFPQQPAGTASYKVADIGTGSGCIAIALKRHRPQWQITGIDICENTLLVAKENSRQNQVDVDWKQNDILIDDIGWLDIIVSNPPYVCEHERATMSDNVLLYEPKRALFVPDDDPLRFYKRIASIKHSTHLFFEINEKFGTDVCHLLQRLGYVDIQLKNDMYGKPRMVYARIADEG